MTDNFDFSGWATKAGLKCSDGRTIMRNAFSDQDGAEVPLVWNHQHNDPFNVLGHALLESRDDGMYAYCSFNNTPTGQQAKEMVENGDIRSLSIFANKLQQGTDGSVSHGIIREVSLVLAGANPGAVIDYVMAHGFEPDFDEPYLLASTGDELSLAHADVKPDEEVTDKSDDKKTITLLNGTKDKKSKTDDKNPFAILEAMDEDEQNAVYEIIGLVMQKDESNQNGSEKGTDMKHNVFEPSDDYMNGSAVDTVGLSHAEQGAILEAARMSGVGSFRNYLEDCIASEGSDELKHSFAEWDGIDFLFPDYHDLNTGAPEVVNDNTDWVKVVMNGVHKSPFTKLRTKSLDIRDRRLRAKGYKKKGVKKTVMGNPATLKRTTDPTTVYVRADLHRDDIVDITDFDVVAYQSNLMKNALEEEIATAILVGDGRTAGADDKIDETKIRPIWTDDEAYTIHYDVDLEAMKKELQGSDTSKHFGENYIYAEAIIQACLYSRENFKGSGQPALFCTPHLVNVMMLARDMNGRRIYSTKAELQSALNVSAIHEIEQLEGLVRTDDENKKHELLGIMVNLSDYTIGACKNGQVTSFSDFDIDFNRYKYLMETRCSGSLLKLASAIVLEIPEATVASTPSQGGGEDDSD